MQRFWNKIRFRQFRNCADDLGCHREYPSRCRSPRVRSPRDRIAAEAVFAPSIGWGADSSFWGKRWVGVVMGILHNNCDGAPGRTRTSTDVNPPDFESGASTNSATGACRRPKSRGRTARIIAMASRRATTEIPSRPQGRVRGMDRASRSGLIGHCRKKSRSKKNSILDYSNNTFSIIPSI